MCHGEANVDLDLLSDFGTLIAAAQDLFTADGCTYPRAILELTEHTDAFTCVCGAPVRVWGVYTGIEDEVSAFVFATEEAAQAAFDDCLQNAQFTTASEFMFTGPGWSFWRRN